MGSWVELPRFKCFCRTTIFGTFSLTHQEEGVARWDPASPSQVVYAYQLLGLKLKSFFLAKGSFFGFSCHHDNYFPYCLAHIFKLGHNLSLCHGGKEKGILNYRSRYSWSVTLIITCAVITTTEQQHTMILL